MATSAFKSTSKRSSPAVSSSSSCSNRTAVHRRARSLSRFSRRLPGPVDDEDGEITPAPKSRGMFVNTVRGSGFPEVSLDDLAIELFDSSFRERSVSWNDDVSPRNGEGGRVVENVAQRRGRSVSRQGSSGSSVNNGSGGRLTSDTASSRRRRSVSVVRYPISDSENNISSAEDEGRGALSNKDGMERTIRAVYAQKKGEEHPTGDDVNGGMYAAMKKELRHAVEEIKIQLEQAMVKTKESGTANKDSLQPDTSDFLQAVSTIRRKSTTKFEKTEKQVQDISAEFLFEEKHGRELSKIVKELLPEPKNSIVVESLQARKRSHGRSNTSRQLTEEAEKYIEDFSSNAEDTDISSLEGDRNETSSSIGGTTPNFQNPAVFKSVPVEMDGVKLPWLQWETSNDASPLKFKNKLNLSQEAATVEDMENQFSSSNGSWSPALSCSPGSYHYQTLLSPTETKTTQFDANDYVKPKSNEEFLHEIWGQRGIISSGGLLLCNRILFQL
ncbi:hypothetical protein V6N13_146090 [Hibiscus sabdariffa]|uniref:Uncharacterized protein n=1 Tax=Hibiscus sabdariffa TaxID=183260 RepID=A0ABR2TRK6_9ROSI